MSENNKMWEMYPVKPYDSFTTTPGQMPGLININTQAKSLDWVWKSLGNTPPRTVLGDILTELFSVEEMAQYLRGHGYELNPGYMGYEVFRDQMKIDDTMENIFSKEMKEKLKSLLINKGVLKLKI